MKEIPESFEKAVDAMPRCTFRRVHTHTTDTGRKAYVYERTTCETGRRIGFEVIIPTVPKASTRTLPNGTTIEYDGETEFYPPSSAWGRNGWGPYTNLEKALEKIQKI